MQDLADANERIAAVIDDYCRGIYTGDVSRLTSAFHSSAVLWGEVKGQPYYKHVADYLEVVRNRKSPLGLGEAFAMQVMSIEVTGSIARAKVHSAMLGHKYVDLLALTYESGRWSIVAKVFTDVEQFP